MRLKRQKRHRKTVRFYTACFGFRTPFKVLCDGTFVHHLLVNRITPADDALSNLLGASVKLFTTRCVLAELKRLGQSYSQSLDAAHNLMIARCQHEKIKGADACIMEVLGETNSDHFLVATQDSDLRKKCLEIPGVPAIFALRNALFLETPSASQRHFVKASEEKLSHVTKLENNMLKKIGKGIVMSDENEGLGDQNLPVQAVEKTPYRRKGMEVKDKVQYKRKRAKGPNPLSCKKKQKPENKNPASVKQKEDGHDNTARSRTRKRKRTRKHAQWQSVQAER